MIDWHELARHPTIHRIGESVRRQLNVWVGFVGPAGTAVPIGPSQPVDKPLCEAFMGRRDGSGSCLASLRSWVDTLRADDGPIAGPTHFGCHAALDAIAVPVVIEGEVVGAAYASGFVGEGVEDTELAEVFQRGRHLDLANATVASGVRDLVRLSDREQRLVADLLQTVADTARAALGGGAVKRRRRGVESDEPNDYRPIIADTPVMDDLFRLLDKVVESESTVLIRGEPGVGKELVARAIHFNSPRADQAFVVQNCSAMNDSLLDSELFGHKKGAFTGAISDKQGLFELADRGTFFLDEIGDMSPMLQVKLLRVLQEGTFLPVGDTVVRKVDVRIIAATNRDLRTMMKEGKFRSDLFYRINVIEVEVPPLRVRMGDVPALVAHFLSEKAKANMQSPRNLAQQTLDRMLAYEWPGNVRELENEVERLVVMSDPDVPIPESLLSRRILEQGGALPFEAAALGRQTDGPLPDLNLPDALESLERRMILAVLRQTSWNKTQTAKTLGISRRNLIRKVDRYELDDLRPE